MPSSPLPRRGIGARTKLLKQLKEDHDRVRDACARFKTLDPAKDRSACEALVTEVLDELERHATLEEEFLYPAARAALHDHALLDEAEVEHETLHALVGQLQGMRVGDPAYVARFTVLCEYARHHAKEEEDKLFPRLRQVPIDWEDLRDRLDARHHELLEATALEDGATRGTAREGNGDPADQAALSIGPGRSA